MVDNFSVWYEDHYHEMMGNGIWFRGGELNTLPASEFENRLYRVLITRLSTYKDTSDSFTHKLLYQLATKHADIYADLAFLPSQKDAALFNAYFIPWLVGISTKKFGTDFHMIAFSNSVVEELVNIPAMLKKSRIPLSKKDRMSEVNIPLIILGGANALYTSVLYTDTPLVDGIFVGEEPDNITAIFRIAHDAKKRGLNKYETLEQLEKIDGFFQPDKQMQTRKVGGKIISPELFLNNAPVMYSEEQLGVGNIQISEGCPCFCSFCAESWGRKPYREISAESIRKSALLMKSSMGLDTVELYSFNFNMHQDFYAILWNLSGYFAHIGLKSQRFDTIAADPELIKCIHAVGKASITCGLEGISQRLRKYLHKSLNEQDLKNSLSALIRAPLRELKIFLIATGLENEEDYDEFCGLLGFVNDIITAAGRRPRIIFSMTPLVRFPYTPLESEEAPAPLECRKIMLQVERYVNSRGFEFRDSADVNDFYLSQLMLRVPDQHVARAIMNAIEKSAFVYYDEIPASLLQTVEAELRAISVEPSSLLKVNKSEQKAKRVQINISEEFLLQQESALHKINDNGYCLGTFESEGECRGCGACPDSGMIDIITSKRRKRSFTAEQLRKRVLEYQNAIEFSFTMTIPQEKRGIPRKNIGVALARAVMLSDERLVQPYLSYKGSFVEDTFRTSWIYGNDCITLQFHHTADKILNELSSRNSWVQDINRILGSWGEVVKIQDIGAKDTVLKVESPYNFNESVYFGKLSLKYTTVKSGEGQYLYQFTKDALKKKIIYKCMMKKDSDGCIVELNPFAKFNYNEFITDAFRLPSPDAHVRIKTILSFDNMTD